ncbi:MAG: hypothetical protein ABI700_05585 [Chloroflexota bacterium]
MMDPSMLNRLAHIRQQEILEQAAQDRAERLPLIQWSRILEPIQVWLQRRSRHSMFRYSSMAQTIPAQLSLEECPCE